ncbi:MAG: V-type ATPase subunit [Candidatus Thorarchaeota archaeon]|nr:V-type ATPase subunit [Candidatus Thorarchaeota archaeon]
MSIRAANEYGFVNARIRGMKSRFISIGVYESLIQVNSYPDFIKILSGTYYGSVIAKHSPTAVPSPDELALILSQDFVNVSANLSRSLTGKVRKFTDTFLEMFFAESIKSIIRGIHVGLETDEILRFSVPSSSADMSLFQTLVNASSVNKMIDLLPQWDLKVALLTRFPSYQEFDSTAPLEVAVEEWYLRKVVDALKDFSKDEQKRVFDILDSRVILRNVLTGIRATLLGFEQRALELSLVRFSRAQQLTDAIASSNTWREVIAKLDNTRFAQFGGRIARMYEDTDDLGDVELAIEDFIAQRIKLQLTAFPFHLGTIIGFFSLKQYEMRNLRSIAVGIERGESAEVIRRMITIW